MDENILKFLRNINKKNKEQKIKSDNVQPIDAITGLCVCGYFAKYPICTKCGRSYPSNINTK